MMKKNIYAENINDFIEFMILDERRFSPLARDELRFLVANRNRIAGNLADYFIETGVDYYDQSIGDLRAWIVSELRSQYVPLVQA